MNVSPETTESRAETMTLAGVGRILAQAREQAGLSREEAAARLRLSARQIEALEMGNMEALPGPTFVRGFIRNYAKLLQVDAQPLLDSTRDYVPDIGRSHISLETENILIEGGEQSPWRSYLLIGIVLLLLLAGAMWFMDQREEARAPTPPLPQKPAATGDATPLPLQPMQPLPEPLPAEPGQAAPPAAEALPAEAQATQTARMQLSCTQPGWVSVRDRDGKEIFNATIPAGASRVVEGVPPFKVVLGNAVGMQVTFNDAPVDLTMHAKGSVARFTLE